MMPLLIALQFLTRLPVRLPGMPEPQQIGRSLLFYPLVGALLGLLLLGLEWLLGDTALLLKAALLLAAWVALSGGLHLDGLADTADAWVGGYGDRERTLAIMKDPRSGPIAVVVLVLVLLLKFAALVALLEQGPIAALLLAPWLARGLLPLLFMTTPTCARVAWARPWPSTCRARRCPGCWAPTRCWAWCLAGWRWCRWRRP